jgi:mono/diheme cytochrome c family protein
VSREMVRGALAVIGVASVVLLTAVGWELRGQDLARLQHAPAPADAATIERGAYLARAGNCMACHTERGGEPYAGGRAIDTPFGTVYAGNLTPDLSTGLGAWSAQAFRRALHEGRSRDGHLLYPVFPYTHTTLVSDDDSDALYAFLRSVPAVEKVAPPHVLRFPVNTQVAVAVWRLLYFQSGRFQHQPAQTAEWNRGAYLALGLAHCSACHSARDALGGSEAGQRWGAGLMPDGHWLAPSLRDGSQAGLSGWSGERIADLLQTGHSETATVMGPMAEVVFEGTQHLSRADLKAMAVFLKALPVQTSAVPAFESAKPETIALGEKVYGQWCADCHGAAGQGAAGAYPALAGNRSVLMASHVNAVQAILAGGFAPATKGHPRPYGMPPFRTLLSDAEVAAVASFVRQSWGNRANAVSPQAVQRLR